MLKNADQVFYFLSVAVRMEIALTTYAHVSIFTGGKYQTQTDEDQKKSAVAYGKFEE